MDRDIAAYCDLDAVRQRRSYNIIREQYAIAVLYIERSNSALTNAFNMVPVQSAGGWVWI